MGVRVGNPDTYQVLIHQVKPVAGIDTQETRQNTVATTITDPHFQCIKTRVERIFDRRVQTPNRQINLRLRGSLSCIDGQAIGSKMRVDVINLDKVIHRVLFQPGNDFGRRQVVVTVLWEIHANGCLAGPIKRTTANTGGIDGDWPAIEMAVIKCRGLTTGSGTDKVRDTHGLQCGREVSPITVI